MATYFVSAATGSDVDDGLSEANAWLTIDKAMNTVAAGDKVWVKGDGDYTETATVDVAGTKGSPVVFEGYTATIGDGGRATINGGGVRASGILDSLVANTRSHYVFKNFRITNHTSHGVNTDQLHWHFKNCRFDTNTGSGVVCRTATFESCEFFDNAQDGCNIDTTGPGVFVNCKFYRNTQDGIQAGVGIVCYLCQFFSNDGNGINGGNNNDAGGLVAVFNCTFDGDGDAMDGITANIAFTGLPVVVNSILYDCNVGITADLPGDNKISSNNLVNANGANYSGYSTLSGEVTDAPSFTDEANQDYSLTSASPAIGAGLDASGTGVASIGGFQVAGGDGFDPLYPLVPC